MSPSLDDLKNFTCRNRLGAISLEIIPVRKTKHTSKDVCQGRVDLGIEGLDGLVVVGGLQQCGFPSLPIHPGLKEVRIALRSG